MLRIFNISVFNFFHLVQQKRYFTCPANHGMFVRQSQLTVLQDDPSPRRKSVEHRKSIGESPSPVSSSPPASSPSPTQQVSRLPSRSGLVRPGSKKMVRNLLTSDFCSHTQYRPFAQLQQKFSRILKTS